MTAPIDVARPLPGAAFGATVRLCRPLDEAMPDGLPQALADAGGLLLLPGLDEITKDPAAPGDDELPARARGRGLP